MSKHSIFFRTDANRISGTGHLMRCLIIAECFKKNFDCSIYFLIRDLDSYYKKILSEKEFALYQLGDFKGTADLDYQLSIMGNHTNPLLIVDLDEPYYYTEEYQLAIKRRAIKLAIITFYTETHFYANIVHNQNIRATSLKYDIEPDTKLLLGLKYVILRDEFVELAHSKVKNKENRKLNVLVTFGGADHSNYTERVYNSIKNLVNFIREINIVVGPLYQNIPRLNGLIESSKVETKVHHGTNKMALLMSESDIGITSGGLTTWELAALNIAHVILPTSNRELITANYLKEKFNYYTITDFSNVDEKLYSILKLLIERPLERHNKINNQISLEGTLRFCSACISLFQ